MAKASRRPGRPRDPRLDDALLNCGLTVMLERGYHATTLTEIARRAGVGTPAIYRRWPTKIGFAIDIVVKVSEPEPIPDTGSIRDDLVEFVALRLRTWSTPFFRQVVFPVLLEGLSEREVANGIGQGFLEYRKALALRIRRSVDDGELRADTDPGRLLDLLTGTIAMPLLFFQETPAVGDAETIVDQVLSGFATGSRKKLKG
jgi:AcrR family transcriptional regulator